MSRALVIDKRDQTGPRGEKADARAFVRKAVQNLGVAAARGSDLRNRSQERTAVMSSGLSLSFLALAVHIDGAQRYWVAK
jgi:hypothetical protein